MLLCSPEGDTAATLRKVEGTDLGFLKREGEGDGEGDMKQE